MTKILLQTISEKKLDSNGCYDRIKRVFPYLIFDVLLPSLDVYSDLSLVLGWLWNQHWKYALSMTLPLLLQFLSTVYKWFLLEKADCKKCSWLILLLQFWPQWRAIRIIRLDLRDDEKAERKRRKCIERLPTQNLIWKLGLPSLL